MNLSDDDDAPDWPPMRSAYGLPNGETAYGSTGQLFEVKNGAWSRVKLGPGRPVPHHGSGPDNL